LIKKRGLHIHPYVKFFVLIAAIVLVAVSDYTYAHAVIMAALCVFALIQGLFKQTAFNLLWFAVFYAVIFCYNFFGWSDIVFSRYPFVLARNSMPVFFALHILIVTPPSEISAALDKIRFPKSTGVVIVTLFRYIPTIGTELKCIKENMKIRGLTGTKQYFTHPLRSLSCVLLPLLVRALNVAEELSVSAITRGAETPAKRYSLYEKRFGFIDAAALLLFSGGVFCLLFFGGV
jgi:energy-coupling factor transport system permease protein